MDFPSFCVKLYIIALHKMKDRKMRLNNLLHLGSLTILLMIGTGCTTMVDSNFEFNLKNISPINESDAVQTVFVKSIRDERQFAVAESTIHPEQMTISSYSPDPSYTKERIVARNQTASSCSTDNSVAGCTADADTFSALGENLCFKQYPATTYVKLAVEKGLENAGYRILHRETDINKYTLVVDLKVERFWYWVDYSGDDRFAHADIAVTFHTRDEGSGAQRNFKISNQLNMKVPGFMNPLKSTVESALIDYSDTIAKNIHQRLK